MEDFLLIFTAVLKKFLHNHLKFYKMTDNNIFGISIKDVITYLGIKKIENFVSRFTKKKSRGH